MEDKLIDPRQVSNDWHMLQAGKVEIMPELVNCQDVLDEVATQLRSFAQAKGLRFELLVPPTPVKIRTDRHALSLILLHLADNAIRFTDSGGVCIELRRRMDGDLRKISTEFSVEDTGVWIQPEEQMRLFKMLKKLGSSSTPSLSQSQMLAGLIGGRIEMMSLQGRGSIFRLVISGK